MTEVYARPDEDEEFIDLDGDFLSDFQPSAVNQLTLRDYFAAAALQGLLANNPLFASPEVAYQKADEMLRVRNETR